MLVDNNQNFLLDIDFIKWRLFQTDEQNAHWEKFKHDNPHLVHKIDEAILEFHALEMGKHNLSQTEKDAVYSHVMQNINKHKKRKVFWQYTSSVVAVLAIGVFSLFFLKLQKNNLLYAPIENNVIIGQTLHDEEVYIISGENKTALSNNSNLEFTQNEKIVITDSAQLKHELKLATASMNKLVVPFGKRSNLTLADGTKVWINSGTQVDFPTKFVGKTREIMVNGEVYIEVKEDIIKPFIVHTNNLDIQVYGTSFNLSDYDGDFTKSVVLVEGSVSIKVAGKETKLQPNRKLEITDGVINEQSVDVSEYISWTKGVLEFNETPISEILKKVGRYYNVQFENSTDISLNEKTCSGKLFLSNNLDSVMVSISHISSTEYQREDNIIHIRKKDVPMRK